MKIKPLVLAASLVALLPNAQIGTAVAVTGLTVALTAPAEAKKSRNERIAARRARQEARALAKAKRQDERAADKIEFSDYSHEGIGGTDGQQSAALHPGIRAQSQLSMDPLASRARWSAALDAGGFMRPAPRGARCQTS